ncbi:hypothetical protein, partial [Massilia brevitalea]|uniref:hypothetical protein n=1 Tax=Massilia brevitalea TaxID=442526 RepID=UPI002738180B
HSKEKCRSVLTERHYSLRAAFFHATTWFTNINTCNCDMPSRSMSGNSRRSQVEKIGMCSAKLAAITWHCNFALKSVT